MGERFLFWASMAYFATSSASGGDDHDCATSHKAAIIEQYISPKAFQP